MTSESTITDITLFIFSYSRYNMYFICGDLSFAIVFPKTPIFAKKSS
ncbi:hypothetical protein GGD38_003374 [Chitinophagaceae bacterium OAS944]|nr:hypothetical protein [Chitinophagaceae bacterium OAS944]